MALKDYHINIFYSEEDQGYIADIPDLELGQPLAQHLPKNLQKSKWQKWHG
jgi:hypothetical protein